MVSHEAYTHIYDYLLTQPVQSFLEEFPMGDIVTWGHSPNSFVVVTGDVLRQVRKRRDEMRRWGKGKRREEKLYKLCWAFTLPPYLYFTITITITNNNR